MSEDKDPKVMVLEAHEEFIQHIERGSAKIRSLALTTIVVATLLLASYLYQIALPAISGVTTVQVNLSDPVLLATELILVALVVLWLYVALTDFLFTRRLAGQIKEVRRLEHEKMEKYGLPESAEAT